MLLFGEGSLVTRVDRRSEGGMDAPARFQLRCCEPRDSNRSGMNFRKHPLQAEASINLETVAAAHPILSRRSRRGRGCYANCRNHFVPPRAAFLERRIIHFPHPALEARHDARLT